MFSCNLPPALLEEWPRSFTCYCGNTGVERTPKWESAQKVEPAEENSPAGPAGTRTRDLSITSPALLSYPRFQCSISRTEARFRYWIRICDTESAAMLVRCNARRAEITECETHVILLPRSLPLFMTSLILTAVHKMSALTDMFFRHSNVDL